MNIDFLWTKFYNDDWQINLKNLILIKKYI